MKLLARAGVVFDRFVFFLSVVSRFLLALAALFVCTEVVLRHFANRPQEWVLEATEYALLYITFLASAWLLKIEAHVSIDVVVNTLNPRRKAMLNVFTSFIGAAICAVIAWFSAETTWYAYKEGMRTLTALLLPKYPFLAVIPLGTALLSIQFVRIAYGHLKSWRALAAK